MDGITKESMNFRSLHLISSGRLEEYDKIIRHVSEDEHVKKLIVVSFRIENIVTTINF